MPEEKKQGKPSTTLPKDVKVKIEKTDPYQLLSQEIDPKFHIEIKRGNQKLTGYPAQVAIDRLNEIFGLRTWHTQEEMLKQEVVGKNWAVAMKVTLVIQDDEKPIVRSGYGASYARRIEDAYGGAFTIGLKRACRLLGVGKELYIKEIEEIEEQEEIKQYDLKEINKDISDLSLKIKKAENVEQLESLQTKIKAQKGAAVQKVLLSAFNKRKIELCQK